MNIEEYFSKRYYPRGKKKKKQMMKGTGRAPITVH
jgi:hypothetical protein